MPQSVELREVWRDPFVESAHCGHAVIRVASGIIPKAMGARAPMA